MCCTSQQAAVFTFENSSLSARKSLMNCTGSYRANLRTPGPIDHQRLQTNQSAHKGNRVDIGPEAWAWQEVQHFGHGNNCSKRCCPLFVSWQVQEGAHLRSGVCSAPFRVDRQGLVSHTMGIFPPSLAFMSASCRVGTQHQLEPQPRPGQIAPTWPTCTSLGRHVGRGAGRDPTSSSPAFTAAASLKPRELNSMPQHWLPRLCTNGISSSDAFVVHLWTCRLPLPNSRQRNLRIRAPASQCANAAAVDMSNAARATSHAPRGR
jgi:hypothetical protein